MGDKYLKATLMFVSIHLISLMLFWLFIVAIHPAEVGTTWEFIVGSIDFCGYIIGIPGYVAQLGMEYSYVYFL